MAKVPSFSRKVRESILQRDGYRCQFHTFNPKTGKWARCKRTEHLHVHHVIPRGWASRHLTPDFIENELNTRSNLLTLCEEHHIGKNWDGDCVHPDTRTANEKYRAGNKDAYHEMMVKREELNNAGKPYWNTLFDWMFGRLLKRLNK